jgi:cytochrome c biogenesis protein CcdA
LLGSLFAFVTGFSVVFVAFGASASAVGRFLLQNKNLLAPFAGAIIVLFGRHLHAVEVGSGILLLAVGSLIFVNRLTLLSGKLSFLNAFVK